VLLTDLLGAQVRAADGTVAGRLVDLAVEVGEEHPVVRRLAVGRGQHTTGYVDWSAVVAFEHDEVQLGTSGAVTGAEGQAEVLLRRDVLDTQVVDVAGKRLARVSEVLLSREGEQVAVAAVEIGAAGVWRRLGLRRLAHRTPTRSIAWADLHLTSARGHALQLTTPGAAVHRLAGPELAAVVAHLPTDKGAQILAAVSPEHAAAALSAAHPRVSARLLHAVSRATASALVGRMPVDDATSALRSLPAADVELLLADVVSERAATLRRLLAHPADTAGGLMNTEVLTAAVGEPVEAIRARVAADVPELEGLATSRAGRWAATSRTTCSPAGPSRGASRWCR
jgi:sporulation protein YlmC with PRC-barrel domain/flagellar motility protein MotE (MotC chaperone)